MRRFLAAAFMLLAFGGVASAQDDGYVNTNVNLRAGPSTGYPVVAVLEAGTPLEIFGCLDEYTWCDVDWRGYRGWVAARYLDYDYRGRRVVVEEYAPQIGVPIVAFSFNDYWGRYYRGRSWYSNNDRWGPPPPRRGPPPGGWNGGPPPGGPGWGGPPPGGGGWNGGNNWNGGPPPGGGGWNGGGRPPGGGGGGGWNNGGNNNWNGGPPQQGGGNWNGGGGGRPPQGGPPPQQGQRPPQGGGQQGGRPPQGGGQQGGRPPQQAQPPQQQPRPPQQAQPPQQQPQQARPRPGNNQEGGYRKPTGTGMGCLPGVPCPQQ